MWVESYDSRLSWFPAGINQVERFCAHGTSDLLQGSNHRSVHVPETATRTGVEASDDDPRPVNWTTSDEQILSSFARLPQRTSGAGH
jgi:hypothetical protein